MIQPPHSMPNRPATSNAATIHVAFDSSMPRACFKNVGPQSRMPYRTMYTKKLANDSSQIYGLQNTSRRSELVSGSISCCMSAVPSTGGKPSDSGVSRSVNRQPHGADQHDRRPAQKSTAANRSAQGSRTARESRRADRMRRIPHRHLRGELARRKPMRHQPAQGGKPMP